jgi:hypothetical protein
VIKPQQEVPHDMKKQCNPSPLEQLESNYREALHQLFSEHAKACRELARTGQSAAVPALSMTKVDDFLNMAIDKDMRIKIYEISPHPQNPAGCRAG